MSEKPPTPVAAKHLIKPVREILVSITNHETEAFGAFRVQVTCRACWVIYGALGVGVHPAKCIRRLSSSMKNNTGSQV